MVKDSRGKKSITLLFVTVSWMIASIKFLISGMTLPLIGVQQVIGVGEYGTAVGFILAIWLGREWTEKKTSV